MEASNSMTGDLGQSTELSEKDTDRLYEQYQKVQSAQNEKDDELYRQYTKHQSAVTGNELRADPENKEKYEAYKQAVKSYYEAHGPDVVKDMMPDMSTPGHLWEGLKKFGTGFYQNVKTATGGDNALSAVGGAAGGALASVADTAAMPFTFSSWLKEKNLAGDGKYDEAAEVAAERMADMAKGTKWLESKLKPSSKEGAAAYEATKPVAGLVLPIAAAKVLGAGASAAEMAQAAEAANTAKTAGVLETVGKIGGQVLGGAGGLVKAGPKGIIPAAEAGAKIGATAGKVAGELASASAEGGVIGGVMTGAQEPVGTPMSEGVGPGMALSAAINLGAKGVSGLKAVKEKASELFSDFDKHGGIIDIDGNRIAVETGHGVGEQSKKFGSTDRPSFHEGLVNSYENMEANSKHSKTDDVIRYGYDPETQTLQVVMSKPTKGDAVPIDRYVYQKVTPELWNEIRNSDSMSSAINGIAGRGGDGVLMTRVKISDAQLNSIIDQLNNGVLDFDPEWGFKKGSGSQRETAFEKPENPNAPEEPSTTPLSESEKADLQKEGWKEKFLSGVFKGIGRIAGQAVKENVTRGRQILESFKKKPSDVENLGTDYPFPERRQREQEPATGEQEQITAAPEQKLLGAAPEEPAPKAQQARIQTEQPKLLAEPEEVAQRRANVEAAIAEYENAKAREEQERQSPEQLKKLGKWYAKKEADSERRQRYKEEGRKSLSSFRKEQGVKFPPSEATLEAENLKQTETKEKAPDVPFEEAVPVPAGKTVKDAKRMSQRMREIDAQLMAPQGPKTRVKLLEERLQIAAELGNKRAEKALQKWEQGDPEADFYKDVRDVVNKKGITNDPEYVNAGEVRALRESKGINFSKFKKDGLDLDALGEIITEKAVQHGIVDESNAKWDISSTMDFIRDAFEAPRTSEPPVVGEPPIEGKAVKPPKPKEKPQKAAPEEGEVTSIKELRDMKKKEAIKQELEKGKPLAAQPAEKPKPKKALETLAKEEPKPFAKEEPKTPEPTKKFELDKYQEAVAKLDEAIGNKVPKGIINKMVQKFVSDGLLDPSDGEMAFYRMGNKSIDAEYFARATQSILNEKSEALKAQAKKKR